MRRHSELDAIVVGAGVIGAALTLGLARAGFSVAIVEARVPKAWSASDEVDPRVVALAADAIALLGNLGVWSEIAAARVCPYRRMHVWDALAPGELIFDAAERGEAALGYIVENTLIQQVLRNALGEAAQRGDCANPPQLLCPAEVTAVENDAAGVTAIFSDGSRLRARVLVIADGAGSPLREQLGIATQDRDYAQRAIVAHVRTERAHEATAWQRFQPGGPLALLPLSDGRSSIVWSLPNDEAARILALDDDAFCAELGCATDFRLGAITACTPRYAFPLRLRLAERYVDGRCVLIGDAAHVVHPLAGQGMNLGLRDVRSLLAHMTAAHTRDTDIGDAQPLRRYERERRSENTLGANALDMIERVFASRSLPLAVARGIGLGITNRFKPLKHLLADAAAGRIASY